jgi:riboflavin-specific deaminase-like protein
MNRAYREDHGLAWAWLLQRAHGQVDTSPPADPLIDRFLPMLELPLGERPVVVVHLAQSLDGRIALPDGESQWITGEPDLQHTHQLRALCDAVLVGANTVVEDDPRLTVRRVEGPQPLRVVVDPNGRIPASRSVFSDGHDTLRVTGPSLEPLDGVQHACLGTGPIDIDDLLNCLAQRGVRRLFVEGGGVTVGHFLRAGRVDRMHLVMAPLLVGDGRPSVQGPLASALSDCPRPTVRVHPLGDDWLFDCAFEAS